jgi:CHAD domain-containing protein
MPLKTRLYYSVGRHLPFLKIRPPQVDRQAALTLRPGRNSLLTWEKRDSGETVLTVPQNQKISPVTRQMAKWLKAPTERQVELDEVGGFVWELCDGSHTIDSIVQKTGRQYKMNRREAEVSVTMFLQMLHERNFIGFYKKVSKKT